MTTIAPTEAAPEAIDWSQYKRSAPTPAAQTQATAGGATDDWEQYKRGAEPIAQEQAPEEARLGKIIGGSFLSGSAGLAGGLEQMAINQPLKWASKLKEMAGGTVTPEQAKVLESELLPTPEKLYKSGEFPEPKDWIERYTKAVSQGAGAGAAIGGTVGGARGALIGGGFGAAGGLVVQGLQDMGVPEDTITALNYLVPLLSYIKAGSKSTGSKASNAAAIGENLAASAGGGGGQPPTPKELALQELQKPDIKHPETRQPIGAEVPLGPTGGGAGLAGRVTAEAPQGTPRILSRSIHEVGPNIITPEKWINDATGGHTLNELSRNKLENWRVTNRTNYEAARQAAGNTTTHPTRSGAAANEVLTRLEPSRSPSAAENQLRTRLGEVVEMAANPRTTVREMMATADSLANSIKYEEPYIGVKEQLKDVVRTLNEEAIDAVQREGGQDRADIIRRADAHYAQGARELFNDEMGPYIQERVADPESLRTNSTKPGTFRSLNEALANEPGGAAAMNMVARDIVEQRMKPWIDNPDGVGSAEYTKAIADLGPLIGEERAAAVDGFFTNRRGQEPGAMQARRKQTETDRGLQHRQEPIEATRDVSAAAKYTGKSAEIIQNKLKSAEGIRELSKDLDRTSNGRRIKTDLFRDELQKIVRGGKVNPELEGKALYEILNKESTYELVVELAGEEAAAEALQQSQTLGNKLITKENFKKVLGHSLKYKMIGYLLGFGI